MNYGQWIKKYKPIKNDVTPSASFAGYMFETCDQDRDRVFKEPNSKIWTLVDDEGDKLLLIPGKHFINRLGYFITEIPWENEVEYVSV